MEALLATVGGLGAGVMLAVTLAAVLAFGWRRVTFGPFGLLVDLVGYLLCFLLLAGAAWWLLG